MGARVIEDDKNLVADYSAVADDLFAGVKRLLSCAREERLAFVVRLPDRHFEALHRASEAYTRRVLEEHGIAPGDGNAFLALRDHAPAITCLTANGALMPRAEVDDAFNELQRAAAALFEDFGCAAVFDRGQCPVNLRFSMPATLASLAASRHPYPSLKMHSDVWAGEPIDFVNCAIPVFMDGEAMNLEMAEAAADWEANTLKPYANYDAALAAIKVGARYDMPSVTGDALFVDSRLLHRTRPDTLGTIRVSLDFRFRPRLPAALADLKRRLDAAPSAQNVSYVPYARWRAIGTSLRYAARTSFRETAAGPHPGDEDWVNHRYDHDHSPRLVPA